jgi:RHS repeat-associated protein
VVEELVGGAITRRYAYGIQRINENQLINGTWTQRFYGYDGFGSVRSLTDPTGAVTDTYDYDAWGNVLNATGITPNVYGYRGEQYDPVLGLQYLRARYFNAATGRFLTRDRSDGRPKEPLSLHKYVYGLDDPIRWADPSGNDGYNWGFRLIIVNGLITAERWVMVNEEIIAACLKIVANEALKAGAGSFGQLVAQCLRKN